jgi:hypothetical protein
MFYGTMFTVQNVCCTNCTLDKMFLKKMFLVENARFNKYSFGENFCC